MNAQGCLWMLSTCGQVSALPAGAPADDALSTGPVYEQALRSNPTARLLYTHTPSANVNEVASALAGHAVHGDACLVISATPGRGASPAVLLDDLLRPGSAHKHHTPLHLPMELCQLAQQQPQQRGQQRHHRRGGGASPICTPSAEGRGPSTRCGSRGPASSSFSTASALMAAAAGKSVAPSPLPPSLGSTSGAPCGAESTLPRGLAGSCAPGMASPTAVHQRYIAMRAILGGRNAVTDPSSPPPPGPLPGPMIPLQPHGAISSETGSPAVVDPLDRSAGSGRPDFSARDSWGAGWSRERREELQGRPCKSARSSREYDLLCWAAARAEGSSSEDGAGRAALSAGEQRLDLEALPEAAGVTWMEVDEDGARDESTSCAASEPVEMPVPRGPQREAAGAGMAHSTAAAAGAGGSAAAATGPADEGAQREAGTPAGASQAAWGDLAGDVVACIALQLPLQASRVQPLASVCRGWRDAVLAHGPLLRRLIFTVDPACCLRDAGACGSLGSPLQSGRPEAPRAESTMPSLSHGQTAMAAAITQQYAAGAFLLPTTGAARGSQDSGAQDGEEGADRANRDPVSVVPCHAVHPWPRLLLAAAQASNPSALLVMAQLLEGGGDPSGSLRWWRKLAQLGDIMGMYKLGMATYDGSHGLQPDPEAAHMWLGRTVRSILKVDSLAAISLDGGQPGRVPAQQQQQQQQPVGPGEPTAVVAGAAAAEGGTVRQAARVSAVLAGQIAALDAARLRVLAWSSIVLGYLEFDGVAGRATWGMGDRSGAVRMFRLAEACGVAEASAVLGWLYNTGQY